MKLSADDTQNTPTHEKVRILFEQQKKTLDLFLERKAISKGQYNKSLKTLIEKINIE